jgi:hypothetical protein
MQPKPAYLASFLTLVHALLLFMASAAILPAQERSASEEVGPETLDTVRIATDGGAAWFRVAEGEERRRVSLYDHNGLHALLISHPNGAVEAARFAYDDPDDPRVFFELVTAPPKPTRLTETLLEGNPGPRLRLRTQDERFRQSMQVFGSPPPDQRLLLTTVEEELTRTAEAELGTTESSATQRIRNYFCNKHCLDSVCAACMKSWCHFTRCLGDTGLLHECRPEIQQINAYCGAYGGTYIIRRVRGAG